MRHYWNAPSITALIALGCMGLCGCDQQPADLNSPDKLATKELSTPSNALKYPHAPASLAELNCYGLHQLRDGTVVKLIDRNPELDATPFGRKAIALHEENSAQLSSLQKWRKLAASEIYELSQRFQFSEKQGEKVIRYKLLSDAARKGESDAQACLANCYASGLGTKKNAEQAVYWATASSNNGNGRGSSILSTLYVEGRGVRKDLVRARELLSLGANRGHVKSQADLGWELLQGDQPNDSLGFKQNTIAGRKWLELAAAYPLTEDITPGRKLGKASALNGLGLMHEFGLGVPKNETEALAYFYLAKSIVERESDMKIADQNISLRESNMSSSARQYSQMRAQELHPIYFGNIGNAQAKETQQPTIGFGSGVFVTKAGHLLTAAHVIDNAKKVKARVGEETLEADILAVDHPNDVALLKVNTKVEAAPVRSSAGVALGNNVFTIGFPNMLLQGTEPKFTEGTISSTSGMRDDPRQFQVSVQVQPGNSGGALFDENGNVVGLVVARLDDDATSQLTGSLPQNVNYAVKSSYALPLLESLKAEMMAEHSRPWFGSNRDNVVSRAKKASVPLIVELKPPRQ